MKFKNVLIDFVVVFLSTLVVSAVVSFLYSFFVHNAGAIDWESSFSFALIFGIIFPWLRFLDKKKKAE
ncbi:MAG: hypothetical protein KJ799_03890 [Bacteroidetes bacterium]|nr:hypothetical protein [Bacteroidota bacterium]MBU1680682.1 hypothetical protein [Bacteroidota bacterium]MBU2505849.1 hypothetical protein [Bacteroidota bacterium]